MNTFKTIGTFLLSALTVLPSMAQQTYEEMEQLTVNEQVTTVITASEPIRFVDISTDLVVGDQPIKNAIRLKPKEGAHADGEVLAIVTIVTERYRTQYALLYTTRMQEAVTDKQILAGREDCFQQSISLFEYGRYDAIRPFHLELHGTYSQCLNQAASYAHATEQYLFRR
jgi:hypothetical protein